MNFNNGASENILVDNIYLPFLYVEISIHWALSKQNNFFYQHQLVLVGCFCLVLFCPTKYCLKFVAILNRNFQDFFFPLFLGAIPIIHIEDQDINAKSELSINEIKIKTKFISVHFQNALARKRTFISEFIYSLSCCVINPSKEGS